MERATHGISPRSFRISVQSVCPWGRREIFPGFLSVLSCGVCRQVLFVRIFLDNTWGFPLLYPLSSDKFAVSCHEPLLGRRPVPTDLLVIRTSTCHDIWAGFRPAF